MATWNSGAAYDAYMGRWSRLVAAGFVEWLAIPSGGHWVDVGCGTGALTQAALSAGAARVSAFDQSADFLAQARVNVEDGRATFRESDATALPVTDGIGDVAVSGLVLNFLPDPVAALSEMRRTVRPGGTVALYVWDYAEGMEMLRKFWDAAIDVDAAAGELQEGARFAICQPGALGEAFAAADLVGAEVRAIDVATPFESFEAFWQPFGGGQGPAGAYVTSLTPERREQLRERVRATLPAPEGGAIRMSARAWAVRGLKPVA